MALMVPNCDQFESKRDYTILNSIELAEKLKTIKFPTDSRLISFYVVSVFSKIPINRAIPTMVKILQNLNIPQEKDMLEPQYL